MQSIALKPRWTQIPTVLVQLDLDDAHFTAGLLDEVAGKTFE